MDQSQESQIFPNPLNLPLVKTPQLIKTIESLILEQEYLDDHDRKTSVVSRENITRTTTYESSNKNHEKPKAMSFSISKIIIGEWTRTAEYMTDLIAKFYFAKKKLLWEILDNVETESGVSRLKRKIEISWCDVLSLRCFIQHHDEVLEIELSKPPTFFMETNPRAGKHTQWKEIDQDFTQDQSASRFRRHKLYFDPGVLEKNFKKLVSEHMFWSDLVKVNFPTLRNSLHFDYGNSNFNTNNGINSFQRFSFNVNNNLPQDMETQFCPNQLPEMQVNLHHRHSQGFGHESVKDLSFNMETQFCPNQLPEMQVNLHHRHSQGFGHESVKDLSFNMETHFYPNRLPETQVNDIFNGVGFLSESELNNPMMQERELGESQVNTQATYFETQTNSILQDLNVHSTYPYFGRYLQSLLLAEEVERQNMEHSDQ